MWTPLLSCSKSVQNRKIYLFAFCFISYIWQNSSGGVFLPAVGPPLVQPQYTHNEKSAAVFSPPQSPPTKLRSPPPSQTFDAEKPVLLSGAFFSPPQSPPSANPSLVLCKAPPTCTSASAPSPPKPVAEAPPTSQALDAPPTFRCGPPPPFQAHGIPTLLPINKCSSVTSDDVTQHAHPPSDGLAPSPNTEVTLDAVTPAGYQANTESQEPSLGHPMWLSAPPSVMQQDLLLSTEDVLQESSPKRARVDDRVVNHNENEDWGAFPIHQSQVVAKSGQVVVPQFSFLNGERSNDSKRTVAEDGLPMSNKTDESRPPTVLQSQTVPTRSSGPVVSQDSFFLNGERLHILGERPCLTLESFESESSDVEKDGVVERRPVVSGHRVIHEEVMVSDEEEEGEREVQKVEERVKTPDREQSSPSRLHSSKKASSLEGKSDNTRHLSRAPKRHFSSPYISAASGSDSNFFPKLKPRQIANRGYYTPIEIDEEFNPFNYEFEQGELSEEVRTKESRVETDSAGINFNQISRSSWSGSSHSGSHHSPRVSPGQPLMSSEVKRKERRNKIPASAYKDSKFLHYVKTLSHEPTYDDYQAFRVSQRLLYIGDDIEVRYKDTLDFALNNIFMDTVEKSFTFDTFKAVAGRLWFEGKRIQDSLLLIPLFARRLKEESPQLGDVVGNYTEIFMENFVTKYLMSIGGWVSERVREMESDGGNENWLKEGNRERERGGRGGEGRERE